MYLSLFFPASNWTKKVTVGILAVKSGETFENSSDFNTKVCKALIKASCGGISVGICKSKFKSESFNPNPLKEDP